jgi:hypothetical protein
METEKPTRLFFVALLYLTFPLFLFFISWCKWIVALPAIGLLIYILAFVYKRSESKTGSGKSQTGPLAITAFFSFAWVATTGVWNLGFGRTQDWDVMRNDLLSTLTKHSWPVTHVFADSQAIWSMRHYLAFYLPGHLLAKLPAVI